MGRAWSPWKKVRAKSVAAPMGNSLGAPVCGAKPHNFVSGLLWFWGKGSLVMGSGNSHEKGVLLRGAHVLEGQMKDPEGWEIER